MDDIMRRIAHIIDHEAFDGDGTLGTQVAQRLVPLLDEVWRSGYKTCHDWLISGTPVEQAKRRQAVFAVTDMEDELEQQERRHQ